MLWKAFWALIFGYLISSAIQVFVTREQMARVLGERGLKQAALSGFFGFVSSSCSFAALAASRTVLAKGAHPVNAMAFLVASTNLVLELGIVLWVLLGWRFVLGNILVGVLMIVYLYVLTIFFFPESLAEKARQHAERVQRKGETERQTPEGETGASGSRRWPGGGRSQTPLFAPIGLLPTARPSLGEMVRFKIDYTFWLNIVFAVLGGALLSLHWQRRKGRREGHARQE